MYMDGKSCTICHRWKPWTSFYKNKKMKDGFHSYCKLCLKSYSVKWGVRNRKQLLGYQLKYQKKCYQVWRTDPKYRAEQSFSTSMRRALKGKKNGRQWETLVGYTMMELSRRMEEQFQDWMTWDNYGVAWHIDHIVPKSWFTYDGPDDPEFKKCWALSNLQPLAIKTNLLKSNKYVG